MKNRSIVFVSFVLCFFLIKSVNSVVYSPYDNINWKIDEINGTEKVFFENNITFNKNQICLTANSLKPIVKQQLIKN